MTIRALVVDKAEGDGVSQSVETLEDERLPAGGLAGGNELDASAIPFLLRGVILLGMDSVMRVYENRLKAWRCIALDLPMNTLEAMVQPATLGDLPAPGKSVLDGVVKGCVVVVEDIRKEAQDLDIRRRRHEEFA